MANANRGLDTATTPPPIAPSARVLPDPGSAVSWSAILAGSTGAAALSLLLLILGTGLGFSAVSPWSLHGISAKTFGFAAIAWLSFTQLVASGAGGYLAGRLRKKWTGVNSDEVFFRDSAHGFLAWAVASLLTIALLTSVVGAAVGSGLRAGAAVAGGAAAAADSATTLAVGDAGSEEFSKIIEYFVDTLFRGGPAEPAADTGWQTRAQTPGASESSVAEITRILVRALRTETLPEEDKRYLGQLIAQRTGLTQERAERRVSDAFENIQAALQQAEFTAREFADEARKASAYGALWMFVVLLLGAFAASVAAIIAGRQRDA